MSLDTQWNLVVGATVLLMALWIALRVRRWLRRRRSPRIHPNLAKYQQGDEVARLRRAEAQKILATSSTNAIAGFRIIRQIEAVFVDGFRRPEEAVEGLKAASAMKGANAVINVSHSPSSMGRYCASGDAVVVQSPDADGAEDAPNSNAVQP